METLIDWSIYYLAGECPDCGEKIPSVAVEGDECGNCGHVFWFENAGN
jgi:hypothetical protein